MHYWTGRISVSMQKCKFLLAIKASSHSEPITEIIRKDVIAQWKNILIFLPPLLQIQKHTLLEIKENGYHKKVPNLRKLG